MAANNLTKIQRAFYDEFMLSLDLAHKIKAEVEAYIKASGSHESLSTRAIMDLAREFDLCRAKAQAREEVLRLFEPTYDLSLWDDGE